MKVLIVSADRTGESGAAINLGDAFLSDSLADSIESRGHRVRVADFGPRRDGGPRSRLRLSGLIELARVVRGCDAVVVGGGTLLQDDSPRPWGGLPRLVAVTSVLCWLLRTRCFFFGVGCDPVHRRLPALLLRSSVFRRPVWVRDEASATHLQAITGYRPLVAADVCLLGGRSAPVPEGRGVVIALTGKDAAGLSAESVRALRERFGPVTFLQMSQGDGALRDGDRLTDETKSELDSISTDLHWPAALELYATSRLVIASRMHALYMGMLSERPLLAVATTTKVRSFCDEFGIHAVSSADVAASLASADAGPARADATRLEAATARVRQAATGLLD